MVNRPGREKTTSKTRLFRVKYRQLSVEPYAYSAGGRSNETLVSQRSRFESEFRSLSRSYCFQLIMNARGTVSFGAKIFKRGVACTRKKHKDNATPERFFNSSKKSLIRTSSGRKSVLKIFSGDYRAFIARDLVRVRRGGSATT